MPMLDCQKPEFFLPPDLHYLNCAYMAPLCRAAEGAAQAALKRGRAPADIAPEDFFEGPDTVRRRFARLIGLDDPERVAITPAVSYAVATAARNAEVSQTDNIVTLYEQFPSNVYTWRRLSTRTGAELRTVTPPEGVERRGEAWNERILSAIDRDTAIVALAPVHWTDGTRFDLAAVGARARDVDALLLIDGTQAVGAMPLDISDIEPDVLVCAAYKWLLGPYSIGVACFGPRFDEGEPIEEHWSNRLGSEDFAGLVSYVDRYQPGAVRFDVGEKSHFILAPMLAASLAKILEWKVERIHDYSSRLTREIAHRASELGYRVEDEAWRAGHLIGVRLPSHVDPDRLRTSLAERNVSVSVRGDAIRISPHVYNDDEDVGALVESLAVAATG